MEIKEIVLQLFEQILETKGSARRIELIRSFQDLIWNDEFIMDENLNEMLSELAYDLDFYEPNEEWQLESFNYFGDDQLERLIKKWIRRVSYAEKS